MCIRDRSTGNSQSFMLCSRKCVVTGSSRGLGKTIALALASHGATVIIHGTKKELLESVLKELPRPHNQNHDFICADLGSREGIKLFCTQIKASTKALDVLIHNAAIVGVPETPLESYPIQEFENLMRINLKAPFHLTQNLLPQIRNATNPSIIFVSCDIGKKESSRSVGLKGRGAYAISKFGLEGLAWVLADELAEEKIKVNVVNPSDLGTETVANVFVYLSRPDVDVTNQTFNAKDWVGKD
eukprot:TRINITY_DN7057_c0_g1_i4.p1 TRINITY_DN7057_c0_g1~~TRINITY_DN7057_c0_g1_i4.p1  ORF type:complete len:243 (-),score=36.87 TRINITY_DN7057_c0_g1_i4:89-817(-)